MARGPIQRPVLNIHLTMKSAGGEGNILSLIPKLVMICAGNGFVIDKETQLGSRQIQEAITDDIRGAVLISKLVLRLTCFFSVRKRSELQLFLFLPRNFHFIEEIR